jgi:peptidoglycan/xylan/chitin deacetylase (PgdA/CDA1 family)
MGRAVVLCYHAIGESWPASVSPDRLEQHVRILLQRGFEPVTFTELATVPSAQKRFAVTFDDAYASVRERAFPVLQELDVPGTVFAVTSFADSGGVLDWPGLLESGVDEDPAPRRSLTWSQLAELADHGWEIGSHTRTHPRLTTVSDDALDDELAESRSACERELGRACQSIAYPFGDHDERVVAATRNVGYDAACSLSVMTHGSHAWPRIGVYAVDNGFRFRLKVSRSVLRLRTAVGLR